MKCKYCEKDGIFPDYYARRNICVDCDCEELLKLTDIDFTAGDNKKSKAYWKKKI